MSVEDAGAISSVEAAVLADQEAIIAQGLKTFYAVGTALLTIRDQRLYREDHSTFEDYCTARWGMQRAHAYRLIEAAGVIDDVSPIGDILPINEAQARPLAALPSEQRAAAWQTAVETAPEGKVTAAHVAATVRDIITPPEIESVPPDLAEQNEKVQHVAPTRHESIGRSIDDTKSLDPRAIQPWKPTIQPSDPVMQAIITSGRDEYLAQDFNNLVAVLLRTPDIARRMMQASSTVEMARILTRDEVVGMRRAVPVLEYALGIYADFERQSLRVVR